MCVSSLHIVYFDRGYTPTPLTLALTLPRALPLVHSLVFSLRSTHSLSHHFLAGLSVSM